MAKSLYVKRLFTREEMQDLLKFVMHRKTNNQHAFGVDIEVDNVRDQCWVSIPRKREKLFLETLEAWANWREKMKYDVFSKVGSDD